MSRLIRILSIALITAGFVMVADVVVTLVYEEPLSSLYASVQQDRAESQLREAEARYPTAADRRAAARLRGQRKMATLARRFASTLSAGDAIGRIRAPAMDGLDMVFVEGPDTVRLGKGTGP